MNQSFVFLAFTMVLCSAFSPARAASVVNNGGGGSELSLMYSFQNYDSLVGPCLKDQLCDLSETESRLLSAILLSLSQERLTPMRFSNLPKEQFVYRTGEFVGSPVEWNKSFLWKVNEEGQPLSYSVAEAVVFLTEAFSKHQAGVDLKTPASLAQKIGKSAVGRRTWDVAFPKSLNLRLQILNGEKSDVMLLEDGLEVFINLNPLIEKQAGCSIRQLSVFGVSWSSNFATDENPLRAILNGRIGWLCQGQTQSYKATLTVMTLISSDELKRIVNAAPEVILSDRN